MMLIVCCRRICLIEGEFASPITAVSSASFYFLNEKGLAWVQGRQ
jgi:hypothetical protein